MLKGVDLRRESEVSDFFEHIVEGDPRLIEKPRASDDPEAPPAPEHLIMGKEMAQTLAVKVGDTLQDPRPQRKAHSLRHVGPE